MIGGNWLPCSVNIAWFACQKWFQGEFFEQESKSSSTKKQTNLIEMECGEKKLNKKGKKRETNRIIHLNSLEFATNTKSNAQPHWHRECVTISERTYTQRKMAIEQRLLSSGFEWLIEYIKCIMCVFIYTRPLYSIAFRFHRFEVSIQFVDRKPRGETIQFAYSSSRNSLCVYLFLSVRFCI